MVALSLYRNEPNPPMTKDAKVVLPCDMFIPGFSVLEIGAVLQGKIDGETIMVEQKEL